MKGRKEGREEGRKEGDDNVGTIVRRHHPHRCINLMRPTAGITALVF